MHFGAVILGARQLEILKKLEKNILKNCCLTVMIMYLKLRSEEKNPKVKTYCSSRTEISTKIVAKK